MKRAGMRLVERRAVFVAMVAAALYVPTAQARSAAQHFDCKRVSGGDLSTLSFTIDFAAKTVDVSPDWLQPLPESLDINDAHVEWTFMRGYIALDRKTLALEWDDTAEYDYLEQIGQPATQARDTFKARLQCVVTSM